MRIARRTAALTLATSILAVGFAVPAFAGTQNVSGGIWNYGTGGGRVWSDYFHAKNCHSSSVQGQWFDSDSASRGQWSEAWAQDRRFSVDHSYYKSYC